MRSARRWKRSSSPPGTAWKRNALPRSSARSRGTSGRLRNSLPENTRKTAAVFVWQEWKTGCSSLRRARAAEALADGAGGFGDRRVLSARNTLLHRAASRHGQLLYRRTSLRAWADRSLRTSGGAGTAGSLRDDRSVSPRCRHFLYRGAAAAAECRHGRGNTGTPGRH